MAETVINGVRFFTQQEGPHFMLVRDLSAHPLYVTQAGAVKFLELELSPTELRALADYAESYTA